MCGIVFNKNFNGKPVATEIEKAFMAQSHRGRSGFGFIELKENDLVLKRFVKEEEALKQLRISRATEIMWHHRIPTSTINSGLSNHPLFTTGDFYTHKYYLVHNGGINNDSKLREEHEKLGIKYNSISKSLWGTGEGFNDSEALLHELALVIDGKKDIKDFKAYGNMAFIILQTDKFNNALALYFGRNSNPLTITHLKGDTLSIKSENGAEEVSPNILHRFDYFDQEITKKEMLFPHSSYTQSKEFIHHIHRKEKQKDKKERTEAVVSTGIQDYSPYNILIRIIVKHGRISEESIKRFNKDVIKELLILVRLQISTLQILYEKAVVDKNTMDIINYGWHLDVQTQNEQVLKGEYHKLEYDK